ncbi:HlyC/CorC family transporter [Ruminiclostridium herbifermentans]|uniref:HlyC/CorC family transporter n=1 Tax=Ruminiclostridium herbifermentans TaxID=2488810 RepID=A0A4U7JIC4_9FIRM|nr:hemolysin family protein [Ruminiclostridium herbifermentans]QNU66682.1 HlyC/CorC family transporter [Ruminiclostridium herbifermentans]
MITRIVLLIVLVLLNAFFSGAEIALISLNDKLIKKQAEEGDKKAKQLYTFLSEPGKFLSTIQIGITLAGFLASAFATESFADDLVALVMKLNLPIDESIIRSISMVIITIILSYFTLVFGELIPKRVAMQKADFFSKIAVGPLMAISKVTSPFVKFLTASTNFFIKLLGGNPSAEDDERITEEEIRMMMEVGEEKGVIQDTEKEMIDNVFEFDDKRVSEIMTPRPDIISIPANAQLDYITKVIDEEKYTRIPVYKENIDNIIGILHVKDLIQFIQKDKKEFCLEKIIRTPYFVPETKKTDDLFTELKKHKVQMAVVIDEYGSTAGIVTMEDLVEEIVGNIFDEYDIEEKDFEYEYLDNNTYIFDGSISLDKVEEVLDEDLPDDNFDTLSGFIMDLLGRIPKKDEYPTVETENIVFKVLKLEGKRIVKVKAAKKLNN